MVLVQSTRLLESLDDVMFLPISPCARVLQPPMSHTAAALGRLGKRKEQVKVRQHGLPSHFQSRLQSQPDYTFLIKSTCFDVISFNEASSYPNIAILLDS